MSEGEEAIQVLARVLAEHPELATEVSAWKKAAEKKQGDERAEGEARDEAKECGAAWALSG